MQRRYCRCGMPILVDYRPTGPSWRALFFRPRLLFRARLSRCPNCGEAFASREDWERHVVVAVIDAANEGGER